MEQVQPSSERREFVPMVEPITYQKIEALKVEISKNTAIDFSSLPVIISHPGEFDFDLYEAQTKLYQKVGSWEDFSILLEKNGYDFSNVIPGSEIIMRRVAQDMGVILDDRFSGFAWNIGGMKIVYMAIREDDIIDIANKYAKKEQEVLEFNSTIEATEYIQGLAEKYFFHEVGHSFHLTMIPQEAREEWDNIVSKNRTLCEAVARVQADKHPKGKIPLSAEAFADIFSEISSRGRFKNRLGTYPQEETYVKQLISNFGD